MTGFQRIQARPTAIRAPALSGAALALVLIAGLEAPTMAWAQAKPCPQTAQNYDRGTDPRAGGAQTAQNYDRGTDPRAGGAQTAQNYDRGTDPRAGGAQTAQNYDRGTDPRAGGVQVASNFDRSTDPHASAGVGHSDSAAADGAGCR